MSSDAVTLTQFFKLDNQDVTNEVITRLRKTDDMAHTLAGLAGAPQLLLRHAADSVTSALKSTLDVPLKDILLAGWSKRRDLLEFAKHPSRAERDYTFDKHEISSVSKMRLQLVLDGAPIKPHLDFELVVGLEVQEAKLKIKNAHVIGACLGVVQGRGKITCGQVTLAERKTEEVMLLGELSFGKGFKIGEPFNLRGNTSDA